MKEAARLAGDRPVAFISAPATTCAWPAVSVGDPAVRFVLDWSPGLTRLTY